jgi:16S rRNA (guanine527-N7)-methyltransferase
MNLDLLDLPALRGLPAPVMERLAGLAALLEKWNRRINLVAPGTLPEVWRRHITDSAQLFPLMPERLQTGPGLWLDLGSGGGFPGLVIAALAVDLAPGLTVELVESDARKCAFLQTATQTLALPARVTRSRIEDLSQRQADVISARALAPLDRLLELALPHLAPQGLCLFLKGASFAAEEAAARGRFRFHLDAVPSQTDASGVIARIAALAHR